MSTRVYGGCSISGWATRRRLSAVQRRLSLFYIGTRYLLEHMLTGFESNQEDGTKLLIGSFSRPCSAIVPAVDEYFSEGNLVNLATKMPEQQSNTIN